MFIFSEPAKSTKFKILSVMNDPSRETGTHLTYNLKMVCDLLEA